MSKNNLIYYHYRGEKRKYEGETVIRLIVIMEDFYPKFKSDHI